MIKTSAPKRLHAHQQQPLLALPLDAAPPSCTLPPPGAEAALGEPSCCVLCSRSITSLAMLWNTCQADSRETFPFERLTTTSCHTLLLCLLL